MSIPFEDVFELREQLKGATGTWHDVNDVPLPNFPNYPILGIVEAGNKASGKDRVTSILTWRLDQWYTRFIDDNFVGQDTPLGSNRTIVKWKELDSPLPGNGLRGDYYNSTDLTGVIVDTRYENIDFIWNGQAPVPGTSAQNFSIRWTGLLYVPVGGGYKIRTVNADGVRVWVDNIQYIDDWTEHTTATITSTEFFLVQGYIPITVEYFQGTNPGEVHLYLAEPATDASVFNIIPKDRLYLSSYSA